MKKFSLIVLCVLVTASAFGQAKTIKIDFFPGLDKRGGLVFKENAEEPYTGFSKSTYENGNPYVTASFKDGKLHGTYTAYYSNGQKMGQSNYRNGKKHGVSLAWHENGKKASRITFEKGKKNGELEVFYPNGQQNIEGFFVDGQPDSTFTKWTPNGQLLFRKTYEKGRIVKEKSFIKEGFSKDHI